MDRKVLIGRWVKRAVLSFVVLSPVWSCVDNKYDLEKDFSFDVNLGGEHLTIPLGYTDSIKLGKLFDLDDDAILTATANGEYRVRISDAVNSDPFRVDPVYLDDIVSSAGGSALDDEEIPVLFSRTTGRLHKLALDPVEIDINNVVPNEIKKLVSATFASQGSRPVLTLSVSFSGLPADLQQVDLVDFKVYFPSYMLLLPNEGTIDNFVYTINKTIPVINGEASLPLEFSLKAFQFDANNEVIRYDAVTDETYLNLHDEIRFAGAIRMDENFAFDLDIQQVVVRQDFLATGMQVKSVTGIVEPNIDPIQKSISLDGLPDFILEDGVVLDVEHPVVRVSVENSANIPMAVDAILKSRKNGVTDDLNAVHVRFDILAAGNGAESQVTNVWISDDDSEKPADYLSVQANLSGLVKNVPESVDIDMEPVALTSGNILHNVELGRDYEVNVHYDVDVPLRFGDEFRIVYRDILDNMQKDLGDVFERITAVDVLLDVENYIPLNMALTVRPVDVSGGDLSNDLTITTTGNIKSAIKDLSQPLGTSASKTRFEIRISEKTEGALSRLEGLSFDVVASSDGTTAGSVLNEKQFLKLSGKIKLPEGIRVNLDDDL